MWSRRRSAPRRRSRPRRRRAMRRRAMPPSPHRPNPSSPSRLRSGFARRSSRCPSGDSAGRIRVGGCSGACVVVGRTGRGGSGCTQDRCSSTGSSQLARRVAERGLCRPSIQPDLGRGAHRCQWRGAPNAARSTRLHARFRKWFRVWFRCWLWNWVWLWVWRHAAHFRPRFHGHRGSLWTIEHDPACTRTLHVAPE